MILQRSGKESVVERWILHKLNNAAADVEKQLEDRNFMNATGALWNFWLYEFCDVYIVSAPLSPTQMFRLLTRCLLIVDVRSNRKLPSQ